MTDSAATPQITLEKRDHTLIAAPQGKKLDDAALKTVIREIDRAAGPDSGISLVLLDLTRVMILPSLALGLLVQLSSGCKSRQQKLKLVGLQPQVRQVFAITRLDRVFQLANTVDAAIE